MTGIELIAKERQEQIEKHGWTLEHDREHSSGQMAKLAATLSVYHTDAVVLESGDSIPDDWNLIKKVIGDSVKALTIAGALIAAEIDRLNYTEQPSDSRLPEEPRPQS